MTKFFTSAFAAATLAGLPAAGQQTPFRTSAELVSVDALVTGPDGTPLSGLTASDFVLTVDGKPRQIQSAQFVTLAGAAAEKPPALRLPAGTPPPFTANTDPPGRAFIIAVDAENIHAGNEKTVTDAAARVLDTLSPADRVGVVTLPHGRVEADLSTDRTAVRKALAELSGHAARASINHSITIEEALAAYRMPRASGDQALSSADQNSRVVHEMIARECANQTVCNVVAEARDYGQALVFGGRETVRALRTFVEGLSAMAGTKSVVFVSERLVDTDDIRQDLVDLGRAADLARVRLFVIQVNKPLIDATTRALPADPAGDLAREGSGLENVAGVTGGEMFRPSGRVDEVMAHIERATSAYYLIGFEPTDKERDGKYHRIQLTLAPPARAAINARHGFQVGPAAGAAPAADGASALTAVLHDNVRSFRDLPLRAAAFTYRDSSSGQAKVVLLTEAIGTGTLTRAAFALVAEAGGQGAEWTADATELAATPALTAAAVQPAKYRARVAASDAQGRVGVVDLPVDARLTGAGPLELSSLMPGQLTAAGFQPRLDFAGAIDVTGFFEIYDVPVLGSEVSATLELSAEDGTVLTTAPVTIASSDTPGRKLARGTVAIPSNSRSPLILRATVTLNAQPVGSVSRAIVR